MIKYIEMANFEIVNVAIKLDILISIEKTKPGGYVINSIVISWQWCFVSNCFFCFCLLYRLLQCNL